MYRILPLFLLALLAQTKTTPSQQQSWEQIRAVAEAQHEIVMLLIQNKEFDRVSDATLVIFELHFPPQYEYLLVEEASLLSDVLSHSHQILIAHQVVDQALQSVKTNKSMAALCREKAYLYKKEGKADDAIEMFEKSKQYEQKQP